MAAITSGRFLQTVEDALGRALRRRRIAAVLPHVTGRLLDVGCGTNDLVRAYRRGTAPGSEAAASEGVDVHDWDGVDRVVEDSAALPYRDAVFDTVAIVAALNHIPDRAAVLRESARVLRDGGRLVVTMIPPLTSRVWHFVRRPWDADQTDRGMKPGEVWGLRDAEVRDLLARAGFAVAASERFMLGVNRVTVATRPPRSSA